MEKMKNNRTILTYIVCYIILLVLVLIGKVYINYIETNLTISGKIDETISICKSKVPVLIMKSIGVYRINSIKKNSSNHVVDEWEASVNAGKKIRIWHWNSTNTDDEFDEWQIDNKDYHPKINEIDRNFDDDYYISYYSYLNEYVMDINEKNIIKFEDVKEKAKNTTLSKYEEEIGEKKGLFDEINNVFKIVNIIIISIPVLVILITIIGFIVEKISKIINKFGIYSEQTEKQLCMIDNYDGWQFEEYIGGLLKKIGYSDVNVTRGSGDYGADIVASFYGTMVAFQCKRFEEKVGPKAIGEVLRGMNKYKCTKGIVVTNNYFTNQALEEAKISNVELWDRDKLREILNNINKEM